MKFYHSSDAKVRKYGLKVRPDNKPIMCIALKGMIASDNIIVTDDDTVGEFEVFSKVGSTWKASRDHDDLAETIDTVADGARYDNCAKKLRNMCGSLATLEDFDNMLELIRNTAQQDI